MKTWEELKDKIEKISPNKSLAISISKMVETRINVLKKSIKFLDLEKETSIIIEDYYEIIKEIIIAIMEIDRYKTLSHEALIAYITKNYGSIFSEYEIETLDRLIVLRNKISYKGFFVQKDYLDRNKELLDKIIEKLNNILNSKKK